MMSHDHADSKWWNACAVAACLRTRPRARFEIGTAAALPLLLRDRPYRLIERKRLQVITSHYSLPFGLICRAW